MIYELRIYDIHPGKMQAILDRFKDHVIGLFTKHNMKIVQFWEDLDETNNRLYYLVEHTDMETRNLHYDRFRNDPEWLEVRWLSELDGPLVKKQESIYMKTTALIEN
ncbi:NIPSNAP family protein [Bacillus sp. 3255]|uniref:NIPSNAP family protein n=1 Tax=Bacillus sp. 3255 TaxID=2817904 RepID=UPI00286676C0|nr:NIPSNAP family protein [Bacillus sp. 3255]MDR6880006.1 hypothetical protein [Bacillus sp. 3255]